MRTSSSMVPARFEPSMPLSASLRIRHRSPWLREQQSAFPMALTDIIRTVCDQCSVTLEDDALTDLPNGSYQIQLFYADAIHTQ